MSFAIAAGICTLVMIAAYIFWAELPPPKITSYTQLTNDGLAKSFSGLTVAMVLTDGNRLCVQENPDNRYIVAQVSAAGGDTVPMPIPFSNVSLDNISPDK